MKTTSGEERLNSAPIYTIEGSSDQSTVVSACEEDQELETASTAVLDLPGDTAASCSDGNFTQLPRQVTTCTNYFQLTRLPISSEAGAGCLTDGSGADDLLRTSLCKEVAKAIITSNDLASTLVQTITKLFLESKHLTIGPSKLCGVSAAKRNPGDCELGWPHNTQTTAIGFISTNFSSPKISHLPKPVALDSSANVRGWSW